MDDALVPLLFSIILYH